MLGRVAVALRAGLPTHTAPFAVDAAVGPRVFFLPRTEIVDQSVLVEEQDLPSSGFPPRRHLNGESAQDSRAQDISQLEPGCEESVARQASIYEQPLSYV